MNSLVGLNKNNVIRVLHVDDDASVREISKQILMDMGDFDIDHACCVDEAFKKLLDGEYDVVVSDFEMPKKDGLQFLKELREKNNNIPFFLFTGKGREEVAIQALNLGADGYHNKQGNAETVFGELSHFIKTAVAYDKSKKELAKSELKYHSLFSTILNPFAFYKIVLDSNGKPIDYIFLEVNNAFVNFSGLRREELLGRKITEVVPGIQNDTVDWIEIYGKVAASGEPVTIENFSQQQQKWFKISAFCPEIGYFAITFQDITQIKQSLVDSQNLINGMSETAWVIDFNGNFLEVNDAAVRVLGYSKEELLSLGIKGIDKHLSEEKVHDLIEKLPSIQNLDNQVFETVHTTKDGTEIPVEISSSMITYQGKQVILSIARNISERKHTEEVVLQSEIKFRKLFDMSPFAVAVFNLGKHVYVDCNPSFEKLCGYSREELIGKNQVTKLPAAELERNIQLLLKEGYVEIKGVELVTKIGQTKLVEGYFTLVNINGVAHTISTFVDITERKKAEDALKESEKRSKAIVSNSPIGIATSGADKHFLSANETFCKILGYAEDELRKLTFEDITYPADLKESSIKMGELENGKLSSFTQEKRYIRKDDAVINGRIMVYALRDQNGKPYLFIAELEDITERKKAEEQRKVLERKIEEYSKQLKCMVDLKTVQLKDANERLVKSERLAAIGELAGMVGHDLRNPLAGIKNATYFLKKKGTTMSEAQTREMLEIIEKALEHSDKIINDLLDYSKEMRLELTKYSARALVDAALQMIQVPNRIQIINDVHEDTLIWVNADKLMRVFMNLIKNAVDAMQQKGALKISSYQIKDCVEISFADTGTGIPKETLQKLFTPLFTTKAQGMGFGLAICKRIVEAHDGNITVETEVNKGTTFTITLPLKPHANVECKKTCINA